MRQRRDSGKPANDLAFRPMRTEPVDIAGLAGPVVVTMNAITGKHSVTVGGHAAPGTRRGHYTLPTADGRTVAARLRGNLIDPYPTIEIGGVKHRTGPSVPVALRLLTLLPLALLAFGGMIGGGIGGVAVGVNLGIVRGSRSSVVKAALMIAVFGAAFVLLAIIAAAIR
jgi:hypothetical protein